MNRRRHAARGGIGIGARANCQRFQFHKDEPRICTTSLCVQQHPAESESGGLSPLEQHGCEGIAEARLRWWRPRQCRRPPRHPCQVTFAGPSPLSLLMALSSWLTLPKEVDCRLPWATDRSNRQPPMFEIGFLQFLKAKQREGRSLRRKIASAI